MGRVRPAVAAVEEIPVGGGSFAPRDVAQPHFGAGHAATLLADLLALVALERGEEILEACVAGITPVELHAAALEKARGAQFLRLVRLGEKDAQRRHARFARELDQRPREA